MKNFIILFVLLSANLTAQPFTDIDKDNDGLIEVSDLETLNAMRYRLDGSGLQLSTATAVITTGCAVGGCKGYELTRDLDFNDVASYQNLAKMKLWTTDAGWQPIGTAEQPFTAIFKTNNSSIPNTIFNLKISRADESNVGLFGHIGNTAEISGIGLLDATVEGNHQVGSLVGKNAGGQISNSYANGHVVGKGGAVGLLVGHSSGSITNSYANGEVSGEANGIGGLVGANHGEIANSYAMGSVVGSANNVGGLVGDNLQGTISNCYTTGSVSGSEDIGGLVGLSNLGTLISNYVSGKASGKRYIGGLVGSNIGGTITRSYWDKTASNLEGNTGGVGLLAGELQSANAQDEDLKKPYYKWSTAHWDFGTAEQYPILKYATGSDLNNPVCGPEQTLPNCGALLLGQHASLKHILFLSDVNLIPNFKPTELNYQLGITTGTKTLQLIPIASNPDSSINISRNDIVIDSDLANGTTSSVIILGENTEIVIEVSAANQRPAQYSLTTHYLQEITILGIPDKAIDEGESIILDASQNLATADTLLSYRWTQSRGKTLFPSPDSEGAIFWLHIPEDYVPATAEHANLGLTLEINNGKTTLTKNITLTIAKVDNGNIPVAPPTLTILEGTAPEIDLGKDPDGSGKDFSYQWQSRAPGQDTEWIDINEATEKTHIISFLTESYTEYRVLINYTDGQGYKTIATSRAARYVPEIMILDSIKGLASEETIPVDAKPQRTPAFVCSTANIDKNKNGLIEICDLEGLNAMRYQLDGSGYKASASAVKITAGCKSGGCNGYELKKDLDFNDDASYSSIANKVTWTKGKGWLPIGSYSNHFKAIFEGNGHTISNLMIDRPNTAAVGLFRYIERGTINKVGLLNVDITGRYNVGGLVGYSSRGTITNSYATGAVEGDGQVGGLVGQNRGTITNSYATSAVTSAGGRIGGLVSSNGGTITNSYATGAVEGDDSVGGLVGFGSGNITNSYATGAVEGDGQVGGLVGWNWDGTITNSYATSAVEGDWHVGGLVGYSRSSTITNSYATGAVEGDNLVGGLVGENDNGTITNSYVTGSVKGRSYDVSGLVGRSIGTIRNSGRKTTTDLQGPTSAIGIYAQWSTANWDFGTSNQYPALKYAAGYDTDNPACGSVGQPACSTLLPGQQSDLEQLTISPGTLSPSPFDPQTYEYDVMVEYNVDSITLNTTATGATIHITSNTSDLEVNTTNTSSITIPLTITTDTIITITVTNGEQRPTKYTITVSYNVPGNLVFPSIDVTDDEGDSLLKIDEKIQAKEGQQVKVKLDSGDCTPVNCVLEFPSYPLLSSDANTLEFTIPVDFVEANRSTQDFVVVFTIRKNGDIASKETTLVVEKENNGSISNIGQPTLVGSQLIAPDLSGDPDKGVQKSSLKYKWQRREGNKWVKIDRATASTYTPGDVTRGEEYRVRISYTDGQGYCYGGGCVEKVISSKAIRDIDVDDDGLIEIRSIDDLDAIRNNLAGTSYKTDEAEITTGCPEDRCKGYELFANLDFQVAGSYRDGIVNEDWTTGEGWLPIGDSSNSFSGIFNGYNHTNGNNHTISNLMIKSQGSDYVGLFAMINEDAIIEGVNLHKVDIEGGGLVGALVGKNVGGTIRNINVRGDSGTTSTIVGTGSQVGGLVGMNAEGSEIDNVDLDRISIEGDNQVGGLVGMNAGGSEIDNVDLDRVSTKGGSQVGGLVGVNEKSTIRNINVRDDSSTTSTIVGTGDQVGGLVGMNAEGSEIDNVDLYRVSIKGRSQVGGLAGTNQGIIINSRISGDSDAITNRVEGEGNKIGGLVGENEGGRIINSHAVTNIQGRETGRMIGHHVGGLVGQNTGQIINSYANGSVAANENVGGLVGNHLIGDHATGEIINSYAMSRLVSGNENVGGLVGLNSNGPITHSYWDKTTSGMLSSDGGVGKTTKRLQLPTTPGSTSTKVYYGWREEIWDFGTNKQYPALKYANAQCTGTDETDYCEGLSPNKQTFVKSLCPPENTPARCNELFAGQRLGLKSIDLSGNAVLLEAFENTKYNYTMLVLNGEETIQIIPTAAHDEAEFTLSPSDNSNEITLENGQSTPTITIEVKTNNRKVTYTFEVVRVGARITKTDGRMTITENTFDEGALVFLNASVMKSTDVPFQVKWEWMQMGGERFLETTNTSVTQLTIPTAYIDSNALSVMVTFEVTGTFTIGGKTLESSAEVELTINKDNNGSLKTDDIGELTLNDAEITVPDISKINEEGKSLLDKDRDGVNENPDISYHWQKKLSNNVWENVSTTTINIYEVGEDIPDNTEYRVLIRYTDGQGYRKPVASESISYVDIDRDNDGLIEIETREELDAIRHQLDGNGYKANASAAIIIEGCPIIIVNNEEQRQCKGYELKAHIDLSGGEDWEPIGDTSNPFNAIFEGNHYTISNLRISSSSSNIGFFGRTTGAAKIRNVGLLNVNITGNSSVGGLIGSNQGKVIGSYVIAAKDNVLKISGMDKVGGLIGSNQGEVRGSHVIAKLIEGNAAVGGLVGLNSSTTITESYAIVKNINSGTATSVGGLVGVTSGGEISNSYAKVDNIKKGSSFVCPGGSLIGKLVGSDDDATNPSVIIDSEIAGDCDSLVSIGVMRTVGGTGNHTLTSSITASVTLDMTSAEISAP